MKLSLEITIKDLAFRIMGIALVISLFFFGREGRAENSQVYDASSTVAALASGGTQAINGSTLPQNVIQSVQQGNVSPIEQWVLTNTMFTNCAENLVNNPPPITDSYAAALAAYNNDVCEMENNCFDTAYLLSALALSSNNSATGGQGSTGTCAVLSIMQNLPTNSNCQAQIPTDLITLITQNSGNSNCSGSSNGTELNGTNVQR